MKKNSTILIVDDDPNNFDIIEGFFYKNNYDLHYLSSGKNIFENINIIQPDLILLDVMMPDLDGITICKMIRENSEWQSIPIIMITALNEKKDLAECLNAGANDFISKPVNSTELSARVKSMLRIKKQYDSLQEMLKIRQEMTNIIVHDLRNPLTNILLCAGILKMSNLPTQLYQEKVEEIISSGYVLNNQIDSLLAMAKIEAGKMVLSYEKINLNHLLENTIKSFINIAQSRQIEIILKLPSSDIIIDIDPQLLRRVLDNLLSNALKFSPLNSQIICELNCLENQQVEIRFIDFGDTIPQDKKELIFGKYQIGLDIKGIQQIGLGLAFCKMAIEAHQGTIKVENNPQGGNIFIIQL